MFSHMKYEKAGSSVYDLFDTGDGTYDDFNDLCNWEFAPAGGGIQIMFGNNLCDGQECGSCPGGDRIASVDIVGSETIEFNLGDGCEVSHDEYLGLIGTGVGEDVGGVLTPLWDIGTGIGEALPVGDWLSGNVIASDSSTAMAISSERGMDLRFGDASYLTKDNLNSKKLSSHNQEYLYTITWHTGEKKYYIRFYKIPDIADYTGGRGEQTNPSNVAKDISRLMMDGAITEEKTKGLQRSRDEGWVVPELRALQKIRFNASVNMSAKEFVSQAIPPVWTEMYETRCPSNEECLKAKGKIKEAKWYQWGNHDPARGHINWKGETCEECFMNQICTEVGRRGKNDKKSIIDELGQENSLDNVRIYTTLDVHGGSTQASDNTKLIKGHTYYIILNNWIYNHREQMGMSESEGGTSGITPYGTDRERLLRTGQDISLTLVEEIDEEEAKLESLLRTDITQCELADGTYDKGDFEGFEVDLCIFDAYTNNQLNCILEDFLDGFCGPELEETCTNAGGLYSLGDINDNDIYYGQYCTFNEGTDTEEVCAVSDIILEKCDATAEENSE